MKEIKEVNQLKEEILAISYKNPKEAKEAYSNLPQDLKVGMAEIYRTAFGGDPWYEKYKCDGTPACGFLQEAFCPTCQSDKEVSEAYPKDWLVNTYFEEMLTDFTPGVLGIIKTDGKAVGLTTGGFSALGDLILKKYRSDGAMILNQIMKDLSLPYNAYVFYDNETCILPQRQKQGFGAKLSEYRMGAALGLGAELICGRTINEPWLATKGEQFLRRGLEFNFLEPDADGYEVNGNRRYFYLARVLK